ncbi:uncharacterized protein B0T23DRAFT_404741 [Neurospora hispaniola]|uniref:C2H2-type domain-containing protein n=1 Tax=Neurospora hispaniola TaxID=588809 RepID=A0AAJ0I8E8_9PEZI|nr:hypothetical protein B0T23DRAFT_404741 [Neurospora hispaniola]
MSQDSSSSQDHIGPLSEVPLITESCPTTTSQGSPSLKNNKEQIGSSSSGCENPQATSEAQNHDSMLQGYGGHETKLVPGESDTERLQACLKHPEISDDAQPASGTHSKGVENITTKTTAASGKPLAKPSLLQSQPAPPASPQQDDLMFHGMLEARNTAFSSTKSDASAPSRKSLPGTSTLQAQLAKTNNVGLPRPILNNTKKTSLPPNFSNSPKFPDRLSSAASGKAHQQKKPSKPSSSSSSGTIAPSYKQASGSTIASVYFKGNGSYYTPFNSDSPGVSKHPSKRSMDGTANTESKLRPSSEKGHLELSSQLSQPVPGVSALTSMDPRQKSQQAHSEIYGSTSSLNQLHKISKDPDPSENTQETLRDDRASEDSELSDVESIDPRSFSSNTTASTLGRLPGLVIVDSDDGDDDNDDDDDDRVLYDAEKNDISRDDGVFADQPDNTVSATNTSCPYTKHTKDSALDDTPYKVCKDQFGNITKTEGALIPIGYQFFDGDFPWICPVRSCRTLHPSIKALGNHFSHGHKGACYNDNLDGTLTFLGQYTKMLNKQPPIIVSKKAMSLDDSPMLEPSHTVANHYKFISGLPGDKLNEHTQRRQSQSNQLVSGQAIVAVRDSLLPKPEKTLTMADPDRPYNMWPSRQRGSATNSRAVIDATGKLEQLYGGLLPSGWTPYYEYPKRQWLCPIRSCQCLTKSRYQFGRHFLTHRGCHMNDNLDGTFTILRSPSQAQLDDKDYTDTPSAVVSREPWDIEPIQSPKIRVKDPSGTQPIWFSLSLYMESTTKGHAKAVKNTTPYSVPTKNKIVQPGPRETPLKLVTEETRGALIPEGYELDKTWPGRPWICPIRSCRVVCKNTWSLGLHFTKMHSSVSLNDNKDGTFSIVGTHQYGAPRVVSKRLVSLHKDPVVEACLPVLKKVEIEEEERKRSQMESSTHKSTTKKPATDAEELWEYLCSMVDRDLTRPSHPSFNHLMALPRIRDLNIIDKKLDPKQLKHSALGVALVIQVTGVERLVKQCTACRRGDGPFYECVSICPELAHEIAESSPQLVTSPTNRWCCMNCVLNKSATTCSLKASMLERSEDGRVQENIKQWMISPQRPAAMVKRKHVFVDDEADKDVDLYRQDATSFSYRRSGRLRSLAETTPSESQKRPFASTDMASAASQAVSTTREENSSSLRGSKRIRGTQNAPRQDPTPGAIQESLEVEDWEREAKAIPRENGPSDNLALSSSYNLPTHQNSSTSSIQICASSSFSLHVIKIPAGGSYELPATSDVSPSSSSRKQQHQTRMCTVIAGKLRVKIKTLEDDADGMEFNIGVHGLLKLEKEIECKFENWGYNEAVLQVVGVGGE